MDLINKPCTLDFSNYIPSLLSKAIKDNTITKDVLNHIEIQFITLLHKQMKKFTLNESSSLPVEAAENILHSIMYTTGIELQSEPNLLKQIEILSTVSVDKIFNNGIKRLKNMLSKAKFYHSQVKKTLLPIELITYTDTLDQGLKNFFDKYDLYFDAHNTILCLDYPLASDELNMIGLQRILDYLKKIYLENLLCKSVPHHTLVELLRGYNRNYKHLIFNVLNLVITGIVGNFIIGKDMNSLILTNNQCNAIEEKLISYDDDDYFLLSKEVAKLLTSKISSEDTFSHEYINSIIDKIIKDLKYAVLANNTGLFFVSSTEDTLLSKTSFIEGTSLEDKEFTKLYEEVISCRFTSDKIAILKNNINSITDLIDMLKGEVLKESDYDDYFSSLNNSELSLLLHYSIFKLFPVEDNFICQLNSMNLTDIWQIHLLKYLTKLSPLNIKPILNYLKSLENI